MTTWIYNLKPAWVLVLILTVPGFCAADQCRLGQDRIAEMSAALFCGKFESDKKHHVSASKAGVSKSEYRQINEYCSSTDSKIKEAGASAVGFTLVSDYFVRRFLISKMLPLISHKMVDDYMKEVGITNEAILEDAKKFADSKLSSEDIIAQARLEIKMSLAKSILSRGGYSLSKSVDSGFMHIIRHGNIELVGAKKPLEEQVDLFQSLRIKSSNYLRSDTFTNAADEALVEFGERLGLLKLPLKPLVRLPFEAVAGGGIALAANVAIDVVTPTTTGCDDNPQLNSIVSRDPANSCQAEAKVTPAVLKGLLDPAKTQKILDKNPDGCSAYVKLYRQIVLKIPTTAKDLKATCDPNARVDKLTWHTRNPAGYKISDLGWGLIRIYTLTLSKKWNTAPPRWKLQQSINGTNGSPLTRELVLECEGSNQSILGATVFDHKIDRSKVSHFHELK